MTTRRSAAGVRVGFLLTEEMSFMARYNIYQQEISLPILSERLHLFAQFAIINGRHPGVEPGQPDTRYRWLLHQRRIQPCRPQGTGRRCRSSCRCSAIPPSTTPSTTTGPDQRHRPGVQAGLRGNWRRRQLHPHDRQHAQLLRGVRRRRGGRQSAGRPHRQLGRQGPPHAGSLPDGAEPRSRLRAGRHRPARPGVAVAGCARRLDVLGRQRRSTVANSLHPAGRRPEGCHVRGCRLALGLQGTASCGP